MPAITDAISHEIELQQSYLKGKTVETIYFGGGTPSLLTEGMLAKIMKSLRNQFAILAEAEITLEANPDDITVEKSRAWRSAGINRLSIGIQSFRDEDLQYLNRVHSAEKAKQCIQLARETGFDNLTIDLIFGIPTLSDEAWLANIKTATDLEIPHISAYALTVEPKTALEIMIRKGKAAPVDEQQLAHHFEMLMTEMQIKSYLHYEISNYCLPGQFARHNTAYWKGETYLGLGPSAHSYNGKSRQWNVSGIKEYLEAISNNFIPSESEILSIEQQYNEFVMTGLRTMWGCNSSEIEQKFGKAFSDNFKDNIALWIAKKCISKTGEQFTLTPKGILLADGIASDLFVLEK